VTGYANGFEEEMVVGTPEDRDVLVGYRKGENIQAVASIYRDLDNLRAEGALASNDQATLKQILSGHRL
jgi:hypothetical protein